MDTKNTFEIHDLEGKFWVRPCSGQDEYNGETYDTLAEAKEALPMLAREIGWSEYNVTVACE